MSQSKDIKRLSELGIVGENSEIELLREENVKLKKELEEQKKENDILRKNFNDTIKAIIESSRISQQPNNEPIIYPYPYNPNIDDSNGTGINNGNGWFIRRTYNDNQIRFENDIIIPNIDFNNSDDNINTYYCNNISSELLELNCID